jgi:hypothetical protein
VAERMPEIVAIQEHQRIGPKPGKVSQLAGAASDFECDN